MKSPSNSIVALDKFILSTRDSGYKSTASAIAELVDNALQAKATTVRIVISADDARSGSDLKIQVADNGDGMSRQVLVQAMRFGGSSRFNDRSGLGRFGMGLPNASLAQARRVEVYTWQSQTSIISTYLDIDEIAKGEIDQIPEPSRHRSINYIERVDPQHGTTVVWVNCDRIDNRRPSALVRKLRVALSRIFRHFLFRGVNIEINGEKLDPIDPLFLDERSRQSGAREFQSIWSCEVYADPSIRNSPIGKVEVKFSELPVQGWYGLSNDEKREMGISNGAGVSIVRGDREVDYGWFFMGAKRRENYDDWWRCEVRFDPILDEAFGITHTKQQVRPKDYLVEALTDFIETTAKALNARVRNSFASVKVSKASSSAEQLAVSRDSKMRPLPPESGGANQQLQRLLNRNPELDSLKQNAEGGGTNYRLLEDELTSSVFLEPMRTGNTIVGVLNPRHQFYRQVYAPIVSGSELDIEQLGNAIRLMILAAARAEASFVGPEEKRVLAAFRTEWSRAMDVLLSKR